MIGLDYLVSTIARLSARVDLAPSFQWATVTATNPLQVRLDGMSEPLAGAVDALVMPPVGRRVMVMVWNRRAIIMGALRGPDIPEMPDIPKMPDETEKKGLTLTGAWRADDAFGGCWLYQTGNRVTLQGCVRLRGSWDGVGNSILFTLPQSARPRSQLVFPMANHVGEIYVNTNGDVAVSGGKTSWTRWDYVPIGIVAYWTN